MKKVSLLLVVVLCLCTAAAAFAQEERYIFKEEWAYETKAHSEEKPILGSAIEEGKLHKGAYEFTDEDWDAFEAEMMAEVEDAGIGTKAAFVVAIRYLAKLEYRIPYAPRDYAVRYGVDYATYDKVGLNRGWGKPYTVKSVGTLPPDGLYCSAMVSWAMHTAGIVAEDCDILFTTDADLYEGNEMKTKEAFALGLIQPGDTVHTSRKPDATDKRRFSHVGVVIGVDDGHVYVAEMRPLQGLVVTVLDEESDFTRLDKVVLNSAFFTASGDLPNDPLLSVEPNVDVTMVAAAEVELERIDQNLSPATRQWAPTLAGAQPDTQWMTSWEKN